MDTIWNGSVSNIKWKRINDQVTKIITWTAFGLLNIPHCARDIELVNIEIKKYMVFSMQEYC